jgi:hypothetical protein
MIVNKEMAKIIKSAIRLKDGLVIVGDSHEDCVSKASMRRLGQYKISRAEKGWVNDQNEFVKK